MIQVHWRTGRLGLLAALVLLLGMPAGAWSQSASASTLRAAFVFNFAKFTEWPADALPADAPAVFCIVDDAEMAGTLERLLKGHKVSGHDTVVRRIALNHPDVKSCQVLYVANLDAKRAAAVLSAVQQAPVLTVADFENFAELGGIANLFIEDGKMRFAINVEAATKSRLQVSSKLLTLARIVRTTETARAR